MQKKQKGNYPIRIGLFKKKKEPTNLKDWVNRRLSDQQ